MLLWFYCYMYLIEITFSIVFIYNIHFEKYVYNEYYSIYEEAICQLVYKSDGKKKITSHLQKQLAYLIYEI